MVFTLKAIFNADQIVKKMVNCERSFQYIVQAKYMQNVLIRIVRYQKNLKVEMTDEFREELNSGKPLFSIQVDDILVQEIFQKLAEQIAAQNKEILELKEQLKNRPTIQDFTVMAEAVKQIQKDYTNSSSELSNTVNKFYDSLDQRTNSINALVQQKTNEMLFAVHKAIQGHMDMLEATPKMTKDAIDLIHEVKLDMQKSNQKIDELSDIIIQMGAAFNGTGAVEGLKKKNVANCIRNAAERDRGNVADLNSRFVNFTKDFMDFKRKFDLILPVDTCDFPQFVKSQIYNRTEAPAFPRFPTVNTVFDYFKYIGRAMPYLQTVLREMHAYICQIDAAVGQKTDRVEFERYHDETTRLVNSIIDDVEDYRSKKDTIVLNEDFEELAGDIYGIVNGASNSAATNTRCIACGKMVQRIAGSIKNPTRPVSQQLTTRTEKTFNPNDSLKIDGLMKEPVLSIKKVQTARTPVKRRVVAIPK
ncbi:hypothetical protein TRFO_37064 [Tritrichomonas foetus]|uniref:Uncharacterized protein n=1 Tax=Tritrichomonas foetus TaxID=1144522 RepID=A0A1J4JHI0_9EUKA|nr:hypothetical protein TRFO_37064 [Tritrichomonas foetus]|eukprot:OHS96724.1 hypothetical protein TRFO_37064 [Tritrichomonas foetus]